MHTKQVMELLDQADTQWVSLSDVVCALELPLNQPKEMVKRLVSVQNIESIRPARISFDDGTGVMLSSTDNTTSNDSIAVVISHQLKS